MGPDSIERYEAQVLHTPASEELRYLPEGPYRCARNQLSWVAIQHGEKAVFGSLNVLDLTSGENRTHRLPGRPGFAFPTATPGVFLVGMERALCLFDTAGDQLRYWIEGVDRNVDGTIINDGVVFDGNLIFGCKDLEFASPKAGLYLVRRGEAELIQLSDAEVCSNGKAVLTTARGLTLLDICSHSKQVKSYVLDLEQGRLRDPQIVVDLTEEPAAPDGMILTPDRASVIVALYDPREEVLHGEARQYRIENGALEAVWACPLSPRVTCPQLVDIDGAVHLVLSTAVEGMPEAQRRTCTQAGCLFVAPTDLAELNDAPPFPA